MKKLRSMETMKATCC